MNKHRVRLLLCGTTLGFSLLLGKITYSNLQLQRQINNKDKEIKQLHEQHNKLKNNNQQQINKITNELNKANNELNRMKHKVVYNADNILIKSYATDYHLKKALKNTSMNGLENVFVKAEEIYGINSLFLASLVANESGWNKSKRSTDGSNNITGHAVYCSASRGSTFNNKEECILSTAKLIKNEYINPKGKYYNGQSIWDINRKYSLNEDKTVNWQWSREINKIANDLSRQINNN